MPEDHPVGVGASQSRSGKESNEGQDAPGGVGAPQNRCGKESNEGHEGNEEGDPEEVSDSFCEIFRAGKLRSFLGVA